MPEPDLPPEEATSLDQLDLETCEADLEAPPAAIVRLGGTFESFRYRNFSLFWTGAVISNVGTWMQNTALAIVVYGLRRSAFDVGLMNFLMGIPVLFLALPAGLLADRIDRRRLIIATQWALLVQAAALGYLYMIGALSAPHVVTGLAWICALSLAGGIGTALTFPAWQAMLPDLVPRKSLLNGIALNSAQFQSSRMIGPIVAVGLLAVGAGMGGIFYINAISFLFVIAALWAIRPRTEDAKVLDAGAERHEGGWRTITAGIAYARRDRVVGLLLVSTVFVTLFGMPYITLLPAIVDRTLGIHDAGTTKAAYALAFAIVMAANGLGAIVGSLGVASLPVTVVRERLMTFFLLGFAALEIVYALTRSYVALAAVAALAGAALLATNSLTNTSIQATVPDRLRGRVMALFVLCFLGVMPLSAIVFGALGDVIGPSNAVLGGAIVLAVWAAFLVARPSLLRRE